MTDFEFVRDMLARANARYMVTVTQEVTVISISGTRDEMPAMPVELHFNPDLSFRRAQR